MSEAGVGDNGVRRTARPSAAWNDQAASGSDPPGRAGPEFQGAGRPRHCAEAFSTARLHGPYPQGSPELAANYKASLFPDEGGPAILEIEVPEAIVTKADLGGEVRFEAGFGLEELLAAWPSLPKRILLP